MRELAVLSFVTLDGVMQSPSTPDEDTSGGFEHGGWATPYWEGVMDHVERTAMAEPYDIVFGRKTYDLFAQHWPTAPKSKVSQLMNTSRKYVATSDPDTLVWANAQALKGDAADAIRKLKEMNGPLLQIHGSATLIRSLLAVELIDEFRIWTFPVVVGNGKRLFGKGTKASQLQPDRVKLLENGVTHHTLRTVPQQTSAA